MPKKVKMTVSQKKEKDRARMKEYRAKMKAGNPDGYREKQRIQKQKYREKNKKSIKNKKLEHGGDETLNELIDKMPLKNLVNPKAPDVNRESLVKYGQNIKRLYEKMSGEPFNGELSFFNDIDKVTDYIEKNYNSVGTRLDYLKCIVGFFKRLNGFEDVSKEYSKKMIEYKVIYDKDKGNNRLSEAEKKNFVSWDKVLKYDTKNLDDEDVLLVKLMTAIPPRRLSYKYLKLVKNKTKEQIKNLSKDFNYITVNKSGNATSIILNVYKTAKKYGRFIINLTQPDQKPIFNFAEIRRAIKNFMKHKNIKSGALVFPNNKGEVYKDFTKRLHTAFRNIDNKNISSNTLRHSFIQYYSNKKNLSLNTIKLFSKYLGHSVEEFLGYRRFDDTEDLIEQLKNVDNNNIQLK